MCVVLSRTIDAESSIEKSRRGSERWTIRVETLAEPPDVAIEVVRVEDLIQPAVERMRRAYRQVLHRHPHRRLRGVPPSISHRH
jgi:hypothetical protein